MRQRTLAILMLAVAAPVLALAAEPIKMMVPANPGGGWDTTGRPPRRWRAPSRRRASPPPAAALAGSPSG